MKLGDRVKDEELGLGKIVEIEDQFLLVEFPGKLPKTVHRQVYLLKELKYLTFLSEGWDEDPLEEP